VLGGGGALVAASPASGAAQPSARLLPVKRLQPGDLVVGPGGRVLHVAERRPLAGGRFHLSCTDSATGRGVPLDDRSETIGFDGTHKVAVLMRGVPRTAVRFVEDGVSVIDGGAP
jgi:hypothetical protein